MDGSKFQGLKLIKNVGSSLGKNGIRNTMIVRTISAKIYHA